MKPSRITRFSALVLPVVLGFLLSSPAGADDSDVLKRIANGAVLLSHEDPDDRR